MPDISRTLQLWCEDGQVYELRIPKTKRRGVISGYFDDLNALAMNADTLSDDVDVPAVYITLNPVIPDLIARSANETIDRSEVTTKDHEISRRRLLLVDCDPIRSVGISSSNAEHQAAIDRSRLIRAYLSSEGFPLSLLADSGNGGHNVYRIDLVNDSEAADLVLKQVKGPGQIYTPCSVANYGSSPSRRLWALGSPYSFHHASPFPARSLSVFPVSELTYPDFVLLTAQQRNALTTRKKIARCGFQLNNR